ncbi:MAG: DNA repair protein RadA [bacterium]
MTRTAFYCESCGFYSAKWMGKCPECQEWNSLVEVRETESGKSSGRSLEATAAPVPLSQIEAAATPRIRVGIDEFDRVLGGGIVPGSVVLICGDPGIGKSTLLLQICQKLAAARQGILYISGEESIHQIKDRGIRIGSNSEHIFLVSESQLENIEHHIQQIRPQVVILDSIQTTYTSLMQGVPGSVGQIREVASRIMVKAKSQNVSTFLVGHVTKDGSIAGPRVLEHIVDTVLYLEGERYHTYRILRTIKNRFGPTNEIGVFEIKGAGLNEVPNPSALFLTEQTLGVSGSVVVSSMEGTRPLLSELQALVTPGSIGFARRTAIGVDTQRVSLLLAVLEKRIGLRFQDQDVYVNVVGGLKLNEPAIDLGITMALTSSLWEKVINKNTVVIGEVGLSGEIRGVSQPELRVREALKLGFDTCVLPVSNRKVLDSTLQNKCHGVSRVQDAIDFLFS